METAIGRKDVREQMKPRLGVTARVQVGMEAWSVDQWETGVEDRNKVGVGLLFPKRTSVLRYSAEGS